MEAVENMDMNKQVFEKDNELESDTEDVLHEFANPNAVIEEVTDCMKTPRATLYEQNETPGGSIYWEPHVEGIPIPVEGTWYDTVDEAIDMYSKYAKMGGFEVKKSGQRLTKSGVVKHKYIMCNREGVPKGINVDTLDPEYSEKQKRNTTTHVTGCKARIKLVLDIVSGRYKKMFVVKAATNKIGATRAHNLLSSMKGGYEYVHGTTDDFKNHQRDVNVFIGESDAQMLINKMENRKMYVPNFTFQYRVENSELVSMFWADEVAKCNYKEFGDIVSFDATFNSNKYNMKFVPFIGIDNHGKCVTLGSGMLLHEDTKSYTWLLTAFMTAFLKEPTMIVTDQDGAMKRAIEAVFTKAKHRLCMWHIMQKIPSKFEEKWAQLIEDFGLQSHKWMTKMSECENSFFKSFTSPGATLVSFMMSYESAMERQRYRQETLDFKTIDAAPKCETKLEIEHHAARVYTRTIFLLVQTEIIQATHFEALDKGHNTTRPEKTEKQIWGKKLTIERLTNEENFLVDDSLFLLSKDERRMGTYVEKIKILLDEVKADMSNPASRNTGDLADLLCANSSEFVSLLRDQEMLVEYSRHGSDSTLMHPTASKSSH
ncbi:FAR1-related sequence 5-like protein [Tanacetum coccineum]